MPLAYQIDPDLRVVRTRAWGALGDAEIRAHYRQIGADPSFQPTFGLFCDLRGVTQIEAGPDSLRELARLSTFAPDTRRVFLVYHDEHFGLARMLQAFCELEGTTAAVFRQLSEAEAWLGLPPSATDSQKWP
jgi:hypothetical protein